MTVPVFLFYLFGGLAVLFGLAMVLHVRNTVAAALSLVVTMISLAASYVLLEAHLVAVIQIMVYAGAIVVLFLFGIMLTRGALGEDEEANTEKRRMAALVGVLVTFLVPRVVGMFPGGEADLPALTRQILAIEGAHRGRTGDGLQCPAHL